MAQYLLKAGLKYNMNGDKLHKLLVDIRNKRCSVDFAFKEISREFVKIHHETEEETKEILIDKIKDTFF